MTAAVLLAAGLSRRMGTDKLQLLIAGRPLYAHALTLMDHLEVDLRLIVTNHPGIAADAAAHGLTVVPNPCAANGMGTSVAAAAAALPADVTHAVFLNADQPFLQAQTVNYLLARAHDTHKIILPHSHGAPCSPCVFPRRFFSALAALKGEQGGKAIWRAHPQEVLPISLEGTADCRDIDTPEDYQSLL